MRSPKTTEQFEARQQWEGSVEEVRSNEIVVTLIDLTNPNNANERAVISMDKVPKTDRNLVVPGAVFYWNIGYQRTASGQRIPKSSISFRCSER